MLLPRTEDDKSRWLAQAGFTSENPDDLDAAIRLMLEEYEAVLDRSSVYGEFYRVEGDLIGVNERVLPAVSIWLFKEAGADRYRFITLKPWKGTQP